MFRTRGLISSKAVIHKDIVQFISVITQLDAQNVCFTISLFHAFTCFGTHATCRVTYKWKQIKLHYITQYTNHTYYIDATYIVLCSMLHTYHLQHNINTYYITPHTRQTYVT